MPQRRGECGGKTSAVQGSRSDFTGSHTITVGYYSDEKTIDVFKIHLDENADNICFISNLPLITELNPGLGC